MPLTKAQRARYPENWKEIRTVILLRAGNCCEGSPSYPTCRAPNGRPHPVTGSRVALTIGHLNDDPTDNRPENLRAWCQRCHLRYDGQRHAESRRLGRHHRPEKHPVLSMEETNG